MKIKKFNELNENETYEGDGYKIIDAYKKIK